MASRTNDFAPEDAGRKLVAEASSGDTNRHTKTNPSDTISNFPRTLEAAQSFLRRAARQLKPAGEFSRQVRNLSAELQKQVLLDNYEKGLFYGFPEEDMVAMSQEIKQMNLRELSKLEFQLSLTPERTAVRYLGWMFSSLGSTAPNPISDWLRDLEAEIQRRYYKYPTPEIFRAAERKIFLLVSLFCSALIFWIEDYCAILPYDALAANATEGEHANPDLVGRLIERHNGLLVWEAVIQIIEKDHLRASVLPAEWRNLLKRDQLCFPVPASGVRRGGLAAEKLLAPAQRLMEARAKIKIQMSSAQAKLTITTSHELIFGLAEVRIKLLCHLDGLKEFRGFVRTKNEGPP
jgi:hypothetical protein